jgi:hypothetical protein
MAHGIYLGAAKQDGQLGIAKDEDINKTSALSIGLTSTSSPNAADKLLRR